MVRAKADTGRGDGFVPFSCLPAFVSPSCEVFQLCTPAHQQTVDRNASLPIPILILGYFQTLSISLIDNGLISDLFFI